MKNANIKIHALIGQKITLTVNSRSAAITSSRTKVINYPLSAAKHALPSKIDIQRTARFAEKATSGRSLTLRHGVSICHATWQAANLFKRILSCTIVPWSVFHKQVCATDSLIARLINCISTVPPETHYFRPISLFRIRNRIWKRSIFRWDTLLSNHSTLIDTSR